MKKYLATLLLVLCVVSVSFGVNPTKPYTDAADGQVLTALWLNGMFNTLYTWAQATDVTVASFAAGVSSPNELAGTIASGPASSTQPVIWTSTGLNYVTMVASGVMGFELDLVGVSPTGTDMAKFHFSGVLGNNASFCVPIGGVFEEAWKTNPALTASITVPLIGRLQVIASTTAGMAWKARLRTHEINY